MLMKYKEEVNCKVDEYKDKYMMAELRRRQECEL